MNIIPWDLIAKVQRDRIHREMSTLNDNLREKAGQQMRTWVHQLHELMHACTPGMSRKDFALLVQKVDPRIKAFCFSNIEKLQSGSPEIPDLFDDWMKDNYQKFYWKDV